LTHLARPAESYQPSNITFSHLPPWEGERLKKRARYRAMAERALAELDAWIAERPASDSEPAMSEANLARAAR
jgi:methylenetetrahydrofolate--tRNA-(uracil-5-)-methyltransferase